MTVYLDTSALVKLYIDEERSARVQELTDKASRHWVSILGYVETCSAFARRLRERHLTIDEHDELIRRLNADWHHVDQVMLEPDLAWRAGQLARKHALRGADAVHLASALRVVAVTGPLTFLTFDEHLKRAARAEGLALDETG